VHRSGARAVLRHANGHTDRVARLHKVLGPDASTVHSALRSRHLDGPVYDGADVVLRIEVNNDVLMVSEMTGANARFKGFAEQCMAEYNLDDWAPDLVSAR
jgi:hypothetical protein